MRLIHVGNLLALAVTAVICTAGQRAAASEAPAMKSFEVAQVGILPPNQSGQPVKKKPPPNIGNVPSKNTPPPKKPVKAKPKPKPAPAAKKAPPPKKPPPVVKKAPPPKAPPPVVKKAPPPKLPPPVVKKVRPPPTTPPPVTKKATPPPQKPVVVAPAKRVPPAAGINPAQNLQRIKPKPTVIKKTFKAPAKSNQRIGDLKSKRRTSTTAGGNVRLLREPDQRVIVKQNNRTFIRHNDSSRFRRIAPNARTVRLRDGQSQTFFSRGDGVRVYDVTDRNGRLLHRYRVLPGGRRVTLIDNRRYYRDRDRYRGRDLAIGVGVGLVVGSLVALAAPRVDIPRNKYIVEYDDASEYDVYEALSAPPVERLDRGYSLEEIRYSSSLRDRMRRVDLDTVTFDFGSWEVGADQEQALERMANGILRVLEDNPDEVFLIEAYTDAVGDEDDNLSLSDRRAQAVAEVLTTVYGVPPENLVTQGYGEENLKVQTQGPERANRRIAVRRISPLMAQEGQEQEDGEDVYQE